jgi:3-(3-hydroxy-phenyl)propionate hydroxylase
VVSENVKGTPEQGADYDVIVVGAGPCGITIANLLGRYGVRTLVLEAETEIYPFPRAVGIDDESLRTYQTLGVVDRLLEDIVQNTPIRYYTSWGRLLAHVKPSAKPFGWPRRNNFLQPRYEAALRDHLKQYDDVTLRSGVFVTGYSQDADGVMVSLTTGDGPAEQVRARYLVGADGGRSTIRGIAGIELTGTTAPNKWLVVDVADDQLDEPYSAVYCDPNRPVLVIPLPYGHRRFEFKVLDSDDDEKMTDLQYVLTNLIAPRYGKLPLPTVLRARIYLHHSRTAERFRAGRVFLAGDAAHLQPPFFGQGMNSGIRDATNLSWKLAAVISGRATDGLLDTYDAERRPHAETMVKFATRIGQMYVPHNNVTERVRDVFFRGLQRIPGGRDYILQMKYKPMPHYETGAVVGYAGPGADTVVGRMFMQPSVEGPDGRRARLDDVLGDSLAVLGIHHDPGASLSPEALAWWHSQGARFVQIIPPRSAFAPVIGDSETPDEVTVAAPPTMPIQLVEPAASVGTDLVRVEDLDGAFRDWLLERPQDEVIVIRPDRYVAAVSDRAGLEAVTRSLQEIYGGRVRART